MNEERIKEVFSDEAFVKQLLEQEEAEQVQAMLKEKGLEVTVEQIEKFKDAIEKHMSGQLDMDELSDDDLDNVNGGVVGTAISIIIGVAGLVISAASWVDNDMRSRRRRW